MEGLRAYAVFLTFCVHFFGDFLLRFRHIDPGGMPLYELPRNTDRILAWLQFSPYGVYMFFVISGFLICRLIRHSLKFSYPRFLWRRINRIYPALLAALALSIVLTVYYRPIQVTWTGVLANVFLLNGVPELRVTPYLQQTWSLFHEVVFYAVFPIVLLGKRFGVLDSAWAMFFIGAVLTYAPFALGRGQALYLFFFTGAAVACLDDERLAALAGRIPEWLVIALYVSVTTAIGFRVLGPHSEIWLYSMTATLFMIKTCYGTGPLNRLFARRTLRRLGNVSYSFFLVHTIPIYLVIYVFGPKLISTFGLGPALYLGCVAFAGSLTLAVCLFLVAERPYFVRRNLNPAQPRAAPELANKRMSLIGSAETRDVGTR